MVLGLGCGLFWKGRCVVCARIQCMMLIDLRGALGGPAFCLVQLVK